MKRNKVSIYISLLLLISSIVFCQSNPELKTEEGYVIYANRRIWYRIIGEGDKTPIILLHGGPGGTCYYLYPLAELSKERPVIFYDQFGSGRSYHDIDTSEMKVENFVEQLRELVNALGLKKFYLYGHSWGTMLGLEYYLAYPDGIEALIFNSPYFNTSMWLSNADALIATLPDSIQSAIKIAEASGFYDTYEYSMANYVYIQNFMLRKIRLPTALDTTAAEMNMKIYLYMCGPSVSLF